MNGVFNPDGNERAVGQDVQPRTRREVGHDFER
jgi:hypothetical protein